MMLYMYTTLDFFDVEHEVDDVNYYFAKIAREYVDHVM